METFQEWLRMYVRLGVWISNITRSVQHRSIQLVETVCVTRCTVARHTIRDHVFALCC